MLGADFHRDPYQFYDKLRVQGPVHRVRAFPSGHHTWLITGYAQARAALADPRFSKDTRRFGYVFGDRRDIAPELRTTMLSTDPPDHTRLRRLVAPAFTAAAVARLRPRIQQITDQLLDAIVPKGSADLITEFAVPLPVTIICELLGVPENDRPQLCHWSNAQFATGEPAVRDQASHRIADYMTALVARKQSNATRELAPRHEDGDLLDTLIAARQHGDHLSRQELVSLAVLLLVAGHETTTNLIGNAVLALLLHPAQHAAVAADSDRLAPAIEELLRYDSPLGIATVRFTTEPVSYGSATIPAEQIVMVGIGAANRDPDHYPDPATLDVDRAGSRPGHLAFGHGPHYCLGSALARAETQIALAGLLRRLPGLRLDVAPERLAWRPSRMMRGLRTLPVRWCLGPS
ncbi:cytochrome P450 family protein [Actinomadura opuntiae]|uniref:cytochrome P450 family protein n=1 Tax=Actinomadura sp. OS1-43 TaxID=604315 RepID=UPI00255B18F8|nr:cytochrome P450 [Actinomadura sp. OS1-43]MDL4813200.1 cytochrome P450 [Actinomadura sp. OS1-43]